MKSSNQYPKLESLLLNKSFKGLSSDERSWVLSEMSEAEYKEQRQLLLAAQQLSTEELKSAPKVEEILNKVKSETSPTPNLWSDILNYKVPVWQVALAAIFFGLLLYPVRSKEEQKDTMPSTYATIQDTISKNSIDPISGLPRDSFYAMNTKMIDSNYHRAAEYNKKNVKAVMFVEHPLEQISLE